jgi:hypothetical protein
MATNAEFLEFHAAVLVGMRLQTLRVCDPGWNELMLAMARKVPLSEIANTRKPGTAASMASRTAGEASSARSFVIRIVENLVVAPGRDSDVAIVFMDDLRSRLANRVQPTSDGHKAYLEAVDQAPLGNGDIVDVLETWEAATEAASGE